MPECSEIGLMLGAAGDGELEPDDMQEVARHLLRCASCTVAQSDYSRIGRELRAIAVIPSLEKFTKSVLDLIEKLAIVAIFALVLHGSGFGPSVLKIARSLPEDAAGRASGSSSVMGSPRMVDVQVDSAFVADTAFGTLNHTNGRIQSGKMIVFRLPGGRILHVQPRAIDGGKIAMEVVLFDGKQTAMTADLNLESGDSFALSGEQYSKGTLVIRISPSTTANASAGSNLL